MDICANCNGKIINGQHLSTERKCKNLQIKNLIGVEFMNGYFKFRVVSKAPAFMYNCRSTTGKKKLNKPFSHEFIVENHI